MSRKQATDVAKATSGPHVAALASPHLPAPISAPCRLLLGPINPGQSSEHVHCYEKLRHPAGCTVQLPLRASLSAPQCSSISQLRPSISYPRTFALGVPAAVSTLPISAHRCVLFQLCVPKPLNLKGLLLKPSLKSPPDGTTDSPGLCVCFPLSWPRL